MIRSLTIDQDDQTLNVGQEPQRTLTIDAIGGADTSVDWTSSATDTTVTCTPDAPLEYDTSYTVTITTGNRTTARFSFVTFRPGS